MNMTIPQAKNTLDALLESPNTRLCRNDHRILAQALELLYDAAMENQESKDDTEISAKGS